MIDLERLADERGFFARSYCAEEFAARGLGPELRQCSVSYNARARHAARLALSERPA